MGTMREVHLTVRDGDGDARRGAEYPLYLCRCGFPGQAFRSVALLLTTRQAIWCRETPFSNAEPGQMAWSEVAAVEAPENGLTLTSDAGEAVSFDRFTGGGIDFTELGVTLDAAGVAGVARELVAIAR